MSIIGNESDYLQGRGVFVTFVFRVDASVQMGTGHVMRCLTLASVLKSRGATCYFICRDLVGHLVQKIEGLGFCVYTIGANENMVYKNNLSLADSQPLSHADWLGTTQIQDAQDCIPILENLQPDWLIVDHYALDHCWQRIVSSYYKKLMVIDDLGDRVHIADFLLDQNYGATPEKYQGKVPASCKLLTGTKFALLRPEFSRWRQYSLSRRHGNSSIDSILVTLGGADPNDYTTQILKQLSATDLQSKTKITVVMGATAPHLASVKHQASVMPVDTEVVTDVSNMAELMSQADLAIGAAGATTWERCCLGLPTIQLVIAENQRQLAENLANDNIIKLLKDIDGLPDLLKIVKSWMKQTAGNIHSVTDGLGANKVVEEMIKDW